MYEVGVMAALEWSLGCVEESPMEGRIKKTMIISVNFAKRNENLFKV